MFIPDKARMRDPVTGNFITQGLFLDFSYDTTHAQYTWKDHDHEFKGVTYTSLKKLYLDMEDLNEYEFSEKYLCGWKHWMRLNGNKVLAKEIATWRVELEIKMRGKAINLVIDEAKTGGRGALQAAKWLAEGKWKTRSAGRPSKEEVEGNIEMENAIARELTADIVRLRTE